MSTDTGSTLEGLVRKGMKRFALEGLAIEQVGVRVVIKKMGPGGRVKGRALGKGSLDFSGDYRGQRVTFDTKSTKVNTRFDLKLIKKHQAVIARKAHERGALAFFLLEFSQLEQGPRYFVLTWPVLKDFWRRFEHYGEPASIPFVTIEAHCHEVTRTGARLDLVGAVRGLLGEAA